MNTPELESPLILIVEDEPKIASLLQDYLAKDHFQTHWLARGDTACQWAMANQPQLVLLDLMLPGKDGLAVCRELRAESNMPIIMLTARVDEIDRLLGLELGADDYICKPFSPREVVARVKAVLRRVGNAEDGAADTARLIVDEERFIASFDDRPIDLTPVEFRLLALLAARPGRVFPRSQLIDQIYTDGRVVSDRTVDSHIKNLRQKLDQLTGEDPLIRSVYGVGYKFEPLPKPY